jgi:hypothetical protein
LVSGSRCKRVAVPVTEVSTSELKSTIERQHGGAATFVERVQVDERFRGKPVWQGQVHVFDLTGHPIATRAYAWSEPITGSKNRRFFAVLHVPPVDSPLAAVKASIVERHRQAG